MQIGTSDPVPTAGDRQPLPLVPHHQHFAQRLLLALLRRDEGAAAAALRAGEAECETFQEPQGTEGAARHSADPEDGALRVRLQKLS